MTRASLFFGVAIFVSVVSVVTGCGVPPPDRLEIVPPTPIRATEQGSLFPLKVKAFRGIVDHDEQKGPLSYTWKSSDPSVADVTADGVVTSTGSGKAVISASVATMGGKPFTGAVSADVDVTNVMVSVVEAVGDFPKVFKLSSEPVRLKVTVKDEKGQVLTGPKVTFKASDYCVEVTYEGVVHPLAVGECSVIVECAGKRATIPLDVRD